MEKIYLTEKVYYTDFVSMGKDVYKYPGRFIQFFSSRPFIKAIFEDKARYKAYQDLKKQDVIPDVFLFKMSYILNPYMSLRYHHFSFSSYDELGKTMLSYGPTVDVYLKDLIIYHLLSSYMKTNRDDRNYPREYSFVREAEKTAVEDENTAYWILAFKLAKTDKLIYKGKQYDDPKSFFDDNMMISDLLSFSSSFLTDKCVLSWLRYLGKEYLVDQYISLVKLADAKDEKASDKIAQELYSKFSNAK